MNKIEVGQHIERRNRACQQLLRVAPNLPGQRLLAIYIYAGWTDEPANTLCRPTGASQVCQPEASLKVAA